jgi:hypothetical protein
MDREIIASCWLYFRDVLALHGHMNDKKKIKLIRICCDLNNQKKKMASTKIKSIK